MNLNLCNDIHNYINYDLTIVTSLNISHNKLKYIPSWILNCTMLKILYCDNNKIENLNNIPLTLEELYCDNNNIKEITHLNLPRLQILHCFNNKIVKLLNLSSSLVELNCNFNNLSKISLKLPMLKILMCRNNKLKLLPNTDSNNLEIINCEHNNINKIHILSSIKILICNNNKIGTLTIVDDNKLRKLICYTNKISTLPNILNYLKILDCSDNKLTKLPNFYNIIHLSCCHNKLTILPNLYNVTRLYCYNNNLTELPITPSVVILQCQNNKIIKLPNILPITLKQFHCNNNKITTIPISITDCINLTDFDYKNNNIIQTNKNIIINRYIQKLPTNSYANITSIQESVKKSIITMLNDIHTTNIILDNIMLDEILTQEAKKYILEYCNDNIIHSIYLITYKELLFLIWNRIIIHEHCNEIKRILNYEIINYSEKCFSGKLFRLINCLVGYYDDIKITIGDSEQISNIILFIKNKLGNNYSVEEHKKLIISELTNKNYDYNTIEEWISFIE